MIQINSLESRIARGRKAISLAQKKGMDTSLWEKELARLEAMVQAEDVARRTRELFNSQGWCLWKCSTLDDEVIVVVRDESVGDMPAGYPTYYDAELEELFKDDISEATLRLVHEAKKHGAVITHIQRKGEEDV